MFFSKINCLYLFVILFFLSRNHANLFGLDARPGATSAIERAIRQAQISLEAALQEIRLAGPSTAVDGMCWDFDKDTLEQDLKNASQHQGGGSYPSILNTVAGEEDSAAAHPQGDFFRQIFGPDDSERAQTGSFLKVLIGELEQAGLPKEDLIKARENQRRLEKKIIKEGQKAIEICNSLGQTIKGLSDKLDADLKSEYFKKRRAAGALQRQKNIAALGKAPMPSGAGGGSSGKATKRSRSDDVLDGRKSKEATV